MTRDEFIDGYCARSNITRAQMKEFGFMAVPCDCGEESCQGWAMIHNDNPVYGTEGYYEGSIWKVPRLFVRYVRQFGWMFAVQYTWLYVRLLFKR